MNKSAILAFSRFCSWLASAQSVQVLPRKAPGADKPVSSSGAICFSGEVSAGEEFRRTLNTELELVLEPGWNIAIVPKRPEGDCHEFASVVNAPYRATEICIST
jgi:hypothetical protein